MLAIGMLKKIYHRNSSGFWGGENKKNGETFLEKVFFLRN